MCLAHYLYFVFENLCMFNIFHFVCENLCLSNIFCFPLLISEEKYLVLLLKYERNIYAICFCEISVLVVMYIKASFCFHVTFICSIT